MLRNIKKYFRQRTTDRSLEIAPDEVLLDSSNLPQFDTSQFEGRIEKPISRRTVLALGIAFLLIGLLYSGRVWALQIRDGETFADRSTKNTLRKSVLFASRGMVSDRNGVPLIWNEALPNSDDFLARHYVDLSGFAHVLGFVKYPKKDSSGNYYSLKYDPQGGLESGYDDRLSGQNGVKIAEVNALGKTETESVIEPPKNGDNLTLTIDSRLQHQLYETIKGAAQERGFHGGAGVIMDVTTGDIVALTSYPEYEPEVMVEGKDADAISGYYNNTNNPFLNRPIDGVYTPGSVVKPFMAMGALTEGVVTPDTQIFSSGSISIPNPFDPKLTSVFNDWRPQGWMDIRKAIAVSSDVYFYEIGGGFENQKGMGINKIDEYARLFGLGSEIPGDPFLSGKKGTIPTPEWKALNFNGDQWRIGDTYHTVIGQYGFQVTPLQELRGIAAIANGGTLLEPNIIYDPARIPVGTKIDLPAKWFKVVQEGMREGALIGTSAAVNVPYVHVAGKTGTAELDSKKQFTNSWAVGFFPFEHPHYAYAVMMEKGPYKNTIGGVYVMRTLLDWMNVNTPEYFK